jgi:hypothetical protein
MIFPVKVIQLSGNFVKWFTGGQNESPEMNMVYLEAGIFGNQFWTLPQPIHHCGTPSAPLAPVMKTPGSCDIPVVYKQGSCLKGQITTNFQQNSIPFLSMSTIRPGNIFFIKKSQKCHNTVP